MAARECWRMGTRRFLAVLILAAGGVSSGASGADQLSSHVPAEDAPMIRQWLHGNSGYRLVPTDECDCAEDMEDIRRGAGGAWKPNPAYLAYYTRGDFDGDGRADTAVAVRDAAGGLRFALFNGKWPGWEAARRAFVTQTMPASYALFYGPPRPEPFRLVAGPFYSHGCVFEPEPGWQFVLNCGDDS